MERGGGSNETDPQPGGNNMHNIDIIYFSGIYYYYNYAIITTMLSDERI
jgi:hypothetical protein